MKAGKTQINRAKALIAQGVGPASVTVSTGISLSTARKLHKEHLAANPPPATIPRAKEAPLEIPITTRLMSEKEIQQYGLPNNVHIENVPKEIALEVGPVGVSMVPRVAEGMVNWLKNMGVTDVRVKIVSVKGAEN